MENSRIIAIKIIIIKIRKLQQMGDHKKQKQKKQATKMQSCGAHLQNTSTK